SLLYLHAIRQCFADVCAHGAALHYLIRVPVGAMSDPITALTAARLTTEAVLLAIRNRVAVHRPGLLEYISQVSLRGYMCVTSSFYHASCGVIITQYCI